MVFVLALASIVLASNAAPDFGKGGNDDDDSIDLLPVTVSPLKQKSRASNEEGQASLSGNCNKAIMTSLPLARLFKEPSAEVKSLVQLRHFTVALLACMRR